MQPHNVNLIALALLTAMIVPRVDVHADDPTSKDSRDVLLMLTHSTLHLRIHVSIGGKSLEQVRTQYVDRLFENLDSDGDGTLTREEAGRSPLLRKKQRPDAAKFLATLGTKQTVSRRSIMQMVERVGGETVVYRQDDTSSDNDNELFKFLDEDKSGLLEPMEVHAAIKRILDKDSDRDENVSFQELLPPPSEDDGDGPAGAMQGDSEAIRANLSTMMRDMREKLLPRRIIRHYDRNRDDQLSQSELGWTDEQVAFLDADGDQYLDDEELAYIDRTPLDIELAIDLAPTDLSVPAVKVISSTGKRLDSSSRPDYVKFEFDGAVVTFAHRYIDPIATALDNAMIQFNNMDGDANGYLEREETVQRIRFARGLFELIDTDGDGKIFGEEMEAYIVARGQPPASSCRVNLYDTGHGFFMAVDSNGDGRIGVRERREAAKSLTSMERDGREGISRREPARHFHIEFVRGSYQMFGPTDQMVARTPSFQQRSLVGPVWFQRMDRNGDGDLTWSEFLGPPEAFQRIDADNDKLIDPREAAAAKSE